MKKYFLNRRITKKFQIPVSANTTNVNSCQEAAMKPSLIVLKGTKSGTKSQLWSLGPLWPWGNYLVSVYLFPHLQNRDDKSNYFTGHFC